MNIRSATFAVALFPVLLTGCFHPGPVTKVGWDSGYMEVKGGSDGEKSLGMEVVYKYTANSNGTYDWTVNYHLISEDHGITGWNQVNQLYNFYYTFTFHDSTGTHTQTNTINLIGQGSVDSTILNVHEPNAQGLPVFTNKHATGQRYGGSNGIYLYW
jgi:hypothetical protein